MKHSLTLFFRYHWSALLASVIACSFLFFFTRHSGIGISPDSVEYLSAAANITNHFSFTDFNGWPLVDFPLGYPCFLALAAWISGSAVLSIATVINCLLFSGLIFLSSIILRGYNKSNSLYKPLFLSLLACSPCLLEVYSMLWSETLFLLLIMLFIIVFRSYLQVHSLSRLLLAAAVVAIACITRYAGICLLGTGCLLILFDGQLAIAKKIKFLLVFILMGSCLLLGNIIRNGIVTNHITGVREKALRSVGDNIYQAGAVVAEWLPFLKGHERLACFLFLLIVILAICQLLYRALLQYQFHSFENISVCFFVVYSFFILAIASLSRFEDLSSRLLSPVYIPFLLAGSSWIIPVLRRSVRAKKIMIGVCCFVLYAGFLFNHYRQNATAWEGIKDAGIPGYTENSWTQSPTVAFLKNNQPLFNNQVIFSDADDAVYFLTGLHALPLPHKDIPEEVTAFLKQPSFYLIWFTDGINPDLVSLDFIKQHKKLVAVHLSEGGAVYFFSGTLP